MDHYQLSIYDFLQDGEVLDSRQFKYQEVPPSETLPQVDEAQEVIKGSVVEKDTKMMLDSIMLHVKTPSSDLDTQIPTEGTDLPLFSVGDVLTVRQASDVYSYQNENYDWIKTYEGKSAKVLSFDGKSYECEVVDTIKLILRFYPNELE